MSKLIGRNSVTYLRTLVKSHKGLKVTEGFAQICFRKRLMWKISQKIHPKETIMKSFLKVPHNLQLHWKRTLWQLFSDDFWKKIQNTVLCQNTDKRTERISQNSLERNYNEVLFYLSGSLKLFWKRTPSQLFFYATEVIRIC